MKNSNCFRTYLLAAIGAAAPAAAVSAADFPSKPVRLVVGFAPGGGSDTTARALSTKLLASFGQQVIVDNRPAHSGTLAADIVAKSVPDGHTILLGTIALVVNPSLTANMPFDTLRDLAPVTRAADSTNILVVHPGVAAKSVKELIDLAKAKPLNAGSSGIGGTGHLAVELFNLQAGVKLTERGRIAVGWLVVEDLVMVLTLVLLPTVAGMLAGSPGASMGAVALPALITLGKVAAMAFDKTGTLTIGKPRLISVVPAPGVAENQPYIIPTYL